MALSLRKLLNETSCVEEAINFILDNISEYEEIIIINDLPGSGRYEYSFNEIVIYYEGMKDLLTK